MLDIRDGYQALCMSCRRPVGAPIEILPRARLTVNPAGDLVMRMIVADGLCRVRLERRRNRGPAASLGVSSARAGGLSQGRSRVLAIAWQWPRTPTSSPWRSSASTRTTGPRRLPSCGGAAASCSTPRAAACSISAPASPCARSGTRTRRSSRAIADQAATLMHVSNWFYNEPNIRLADALCRRTGLRPRVLLQLGHGGERGDAQARRAITSTRSARRSASASWRSRTRSTGAPSARCR